MYFVTNLESIGMRSSPSQRPIGLGQLANSNSIRRVAGSRLEIRKLRTCPGPATSLAAEADPPCFHFAASMALKEETSLSFAGSAAAAVSGAVFKWQVPITP